VGLVDDSDIIAAALLHDTIEDTNTTGEDLEAIFGSRVRGFVEEVSDDTRLYKNERKRLQIEHAADLSTGATLIKLADKICNVADIAVAPPKGWDVQRRLEYLDWAEAVINNCSKVNSALETRFYEELAKARKTFANE